MIHTIQSKEQLHALIAANNGVMIYFFNDNCTPCISLRPKIESLINSAFPLMNLGFVNSVEYPDLPAEYGVFASPSLIVFFEGKETIRESKYVSLEDFHQKLERYYTMVFNT